MSDKPIGRAIHDTAELARLLANSLRSDIQELIESPDIANHPRGIGIAWKLKEAASSSAEAAGFLEAALDTYNRGAPDNN